MVVRQAIDWAASYLLGSGGFFLNLWGGLDHLRLWDRELLKRHQREIRDRFFKGESGERIGKGAEVARFRAQAASETFLNVFGGARREDGVDVEGIVVVHCVCSDSKLKVI